MLYEAAEDAGVRFPSATYTPFVDKLSTTLMREGLDDVLYPKVSRINKIMSESVDRNPSLMDMETLRRQFGDAAKSPDPAERRLAQIGIDAVDDFVEAGDGATSGALKEARQTWSRMRQREMVQTAIEKATTAQQGFEAGLRAEFKSLYRAYLDKRPKMRGVSPRAGEGAEGCRRGQRDLEHLEAHRLPQRRQRATAGHAEHAPGWRRRRRARLRGWRSRWCGSRRGDWHRWQDSLQGVARLTSPSDGPIWRDRSRPEARHPNRRPSRQPAADGHRGLRQWAQCPSRLSSPVPSAEDDRHWPDRPPTSVSAGRGLSPPPPRPFPRSDR